MVPLCNFHLLVGDLSSRKWKMSKSEWKRGWASESPSEDYPDWTVKEWNFYYIRHWYSPVSLDLVRLQLVQMSFKWDGSVGKKICLQCSRCRRLRFNPWVKKISWKGKWQPTPVFLLENSMDRGAWQATVHRVAEESDMTKWLHRYITNVLKM